MNMRTAFRGLKLGDVCTGTIMRFNLQSARLKRLGIVRLNKQQTDWMFLGLRPGARK